MFSEYCQLEWVCWTTRAARGHPVQHLRVTSAKWFKVRWRNLLRIKNKTIYCFTATGIYVSIQFFPNLLKVFVLMTSCGIESFSDTYIHTLPFLVLKQLCVHCWIFLTFLPELI